MAGEGAEERLCLSRPRAQVKPRGAARRGAPGRPRRNPLGGLALGDVPLQAVVQLLEDKLGRTPEVGRLQWHVTEGEAAERITAGAARRAAPGRPPWLHLRPRPREGEARVRTLSLIHL